MGTAPEFIVSTPYPEATISAIARAAARSDRLKAFYTTLLIPAWAKRLADHMPPSSLQRAISRELKRRSFGPLEAGRVTTVATISELEHLIARRIPGAPKAAAANRMYKVKADFDSAVALRLSAENQIASGDVVVGMYAAAALTFEAAARKGAIKALQFVNGHPEFHNGQLKRFAELADDHHEIVPKHVALRVSAELDRADVVLVPSRLVAGQLRDRGVPADRLIVEPYGIDTDKFRPVPKPITQPNKAIRCLYVGQISFRKGIAILLEAARQLSSDLVEFRLIGPLVSPEVLRRLPPTVRWSASMPQSELVAELSGCDIFVLPSLEDAYPLVTLEAMACAAPVIVTDCAGTSELITNGSDGFVVKAGSVESLVVAIRRLARDEELRRSVGANARVRIESTNSWEEYGCRIVQRLADATEGASLRNRVRSK